MTELHDLLRNNLPESDHHLAYRSIEVSILTAYYTPEIIPQTLYQVLKENDIYPKHPYEPSSGAGVFVTELIKHKNQ